MATLKDLLPTEPQRVIDLLRAANMDVTDWANMKGGEKNAAWNPRYCYEWCFVDPDKLVVLNLWYRELEEDNGKIFRNLNMRSVIRMAGVADIPARKKRAQKMDEALQVAWKKKLPIRIIVCSLADFDLEQPKKGSSVDLRKLDSEPWTIVNYDWNSGDCLLVRGPEEMSHDPFIDQFEDADDGPEEVEKSSITTQVYKRCPEVRRQARLRANGQCEWCDVMGFRTASGKIYIETHHVVPLSEGGPDSLQNVVALCATHHCEAHHGEKREEMKETFLAKLSGKAAPA